MQIVVPTLALALPLIALAANSVNGQPPSSLDAVRQRLASGESTKIVCFGDSITGAYYHTGGQRAWCDMLGIALERAYPQARVEMVNAGISGQTTAEGLSRIEKDVTDKNPHLVVVMFGMNDVARLPLEDFAANLRTIVKRCRSAGSAVVLCTPNSVYENNARSNRKLAELAKRIRQLAEDQSLPMVDCFADFEKRLERDETGWMLLMSDEIHPNMHGHCRIAELIAETVSGRPVELNDVPPPAAALHHTLERIEANAPIHLVAMPPYDQLMAEVLRQQFPQVNLRVTSWPIESQSLSEMRRWAAGIRELKPDLVVAAVPAGASAADAGVYIRDYEWILNYCFPFAGRAWDVVPVLPSVTGSVDATHMPNVRLARQIIAGKDVRFLDRPADDKRDPKAILTSLISEQRETRLTAWPALPATNGAVLIPAQEWPQRPGRRNVRVLVHYPNGKLESVNRQTGIMLSLHNWGGEDCVGTADPQILADRLNTITLCVNYLQSGRPDSIDGPEPYDFGYLQALDALRAVWWIKSCLQAQQQPFDDGRIFAVGGSGGGNVTLMANKLAPRTFACVVDMCGMKTLSPDIAFNLPGGSSLNARWSRDPTDRNYLSADAQDLRFVGHPDHLTVMKKLGSSCRIVTVHGVDDTTCPFADAQEMIANLQTSGLAIDPHLIGEADLDGKIFTSSGHALGDRTEIVFQVAGKYLLPEGPQAVIRRGPSDFDRRDELVRYPTPGGQFVISYAAGFPIGRFQPAQAVLYDDHADLGSYRDSDGNRQIVRTREQWEIRRRHIVDNLQQVMGYMPGASQRVPLDVKIVEETRTGSILRRKVSFQSDAFDRVTAWILLPESAEGQKRPALLCLHQTVSEGKDEPIGLAGSPNMQYGLELAKRGFVVIAPDYPSLGEHAYDFASHPEFASGSLKAVWDNGRAIDLLETLPNVDAKRIGVIGHSLGGHNGLFSAVFEPRLKVAVASCGFTSFAKDDLPSWTGPRYMPRIASKYKNDPSLMPFDFHEIVASIAPRPLLICAATRDSDFDVSGVRDCVASARSVYALFGLPELLVADYPDSPHDFPPEARRRAYEFLERHLQAE